MKSLIFSLAIVLICVYIVFRPIFHKNITVIDPIKADPPARESRPMPYPVDVLNSDAPTLMKDVAVHVSM